MKSLASDLIRRMPELTALRSSEAVLANAKLNKPFIKQTVLDLVQESSTSATQSAIVVSAGPSLHRTDSVQRIAKSGYGGTVICADGALGHCLRNGLIPDYVVTLDPHPTRIVRWFGDPELADHDGDEYFQRQDLDPYLAENELARNNELIQLVNQHGPSIKAIVCTSASQSVTRRCLDSGMQIYWWNPLLDDFSDSESMTRKIYLQNKAPCMSSGGNSGTAAWVSAHAILGAKEVALTGMDFGYAPGTPLDKTQYYTDIVDLFGDRAPDAFISVENPFLDQTWFTDPAYYWYRQNFLQMAEDADCTTFNCTEGGILFGEGVQFISLTEFLDSSSGESSQT